MANPEHVEIVSRGVKALREWRAKNPEATLDLSMTDLTGANLSGANLADTNFSKVYIVEADFSGADLRRSNFNQAMLIDTNFRGADLSSANLSGADLAVSDFRMAKLSCANLVEADLSEAQLGQADLSWAACEYTSFTDVDLSTVDGLDTVRHSGPSRLTTSSLRLSNGDIPADFLRGCGLQPWEVMAAKLYDPALTPHEISEIQYAIFSERVKGFFLSGLFISYARDDSQFVDKLFERLQKEGANVWLDRHDLVAGDVQKQIGRAIRLNDVVLLVLSESSIKSDWVEHELEMARKKEKNEGRDVLCPVALDDCWKSKVDDVLWRQVQKKNILDFSHWKTKAFEESFRMLVDGLKVYYGPQAEK